MTPAPPHAGPFRVGDYELLGEIGKGAYGSVHRARHLRTGQVVAVKLLNPDLSQDPQAFGRFEREFRAARRLKDSNIVRSLAFGREGDVPYLVMEFVPGESLAARIERDGPLGEDEAFGITGQVARALHCAHEAGLIHRDVKPANILLAGGQARLSDFGLAKDLAAVSSLTRTATSLGTPNYMAPEQLEDAKRVDRRCDVYGLAATLYFAITGSAPFAVEGTRGTLPRKLRGELVPPRQLATWLSARSEWAIMRALSVSPALRPASCPEFILNLTGEELHETDPSPAPPPTPAPACTGPVVRDERKDLPARTAPAPEPVRTGPERRAAVRYACGLRGGCRELDGADGVGWPAEIRDVSATGIGLILSRRFERGATLLVEVHTRRPGGVSTLLARVVYVLPDARRGWSVGCQLSRELNAEELRELV